MRRGATRLKNVLDVAAAATLLLLIGPFVMAPLALLIWLTSRKGEPVLFRQTRVGLDGQPFRFYKFRTMVADAEARQAELERLNETQPPAFKMREDPRVTRLGRVLRRHSLDELPQLWNVLKGEMSLVGPRPHLPSEVRHYQDWQRRRLSVKPGLTCLWQVSGRNRVGFDDWIRMDLDYIDRWSLWLDAKLVVKTIWVVLSGQGM